MPAKYAAAARRHFSRLFQKKTAAISAGGLPVGASRGARLPESPGVLFRTPTLPTSAALVYFFKSTYLAKYRDVVPKRPGAPALGHAEEDAMAKKEIKKILCA
ncbi:hypothetical protein, partial [Desulfovibrio sp.]|uniref:hypothetical protein n=1 Tax=Desulfovibrio sp. TaxID=885 RepID=UPI0023CDA939